GLAARAALPMVHGHEAADAPAEAPAAQAPREAGAVPVLEATGFDLLVTPPGARVRLDGRTIGAAPLRVRNLVPGRHAVDVEGPTGYFSLHLEVDVVAGEAPELVHALEQVDPVPVEQVDEEADDIADDLRAEAAPRRRAPRRAAAQTASRSRATREPV